MQLKFLSILFSFLIIFILSGCVTTSLQTNATMTQSIFLDPVAKEKRTIFLNVKNTSGYNVHLEPKLRIALQSKGYTIVDDPEMATYILSTNVLYCDKKQENNAAKGATLGGAIGTGIGAYNHSSATGTIASGAAGALIGGVIGKLTEDTIWQMQVDINIKQKTQNKVMTSSGDIKGQTNVVDSKASGFLNSFGGPVRNDQVGTLNTNQRNSTQQVYESNFIEKSTIIFAEAIKLGLQLLEATPILEDKVTSQIAGLF